MEAVTNQVKQMNLKVFTEQNLPVAIWLNFDSCIRSGLKVDTKRANKNRPMEITSKKPVGRFREVIQAPKRFAVRDLPERIVVL
ncbi:hypothetical protein R1flu_008087 [Riccia fluitans]|uniref:rRNA biogenesis protein RRP36 n=1 Tax=Riccia fluitans TaxID=41844 RepID=A0ABD1YDT0_9MARC